MSIVYLAVWKSGTIYIGQTTGPLVRLTKRYVSYANSKRKTKRLSEMECRLYGTPVFRILETCSPNKLDEREQYWIGVYSCYPNCLNCAGRAPTYEAMWEAAHWAKMAEWEAGREERIQARILELLKL